MLLDAMCKQKYEFSFMQKMLGHLTFMRNVVSGRTFCRQLAFAMRRFSKPHYRIWILHRVRKDMQV